MKFGEVIANALAPAIEKQLEKKFAEILRKIHPADTRRDVLIMLYVPVDSQLERLADETKTELDDAGVMALKKAIETVAAEDQIQLPNVDGD
jgi:hypothetical protein